MKKGMKKTITSLLLATLAITGNPTFVFAEDGTDDSNPTEIMQPDQSEAEETPPVESDAPTESPDSNSEVTFDNSAPAPSTEIITDGSENQTSEEPTAPVQEGLSDEEIDKMLDGDKERVGLYKHTQDKINESIQKDPHVELVLDGNGYVEVTAPDGSVANYRWYQNELISSAEDSPYFANINDSTYTEESLKEMGMSDEQIESLKGADGALLLVPQYEIYGNEGDTFHFKFISDNNEKLSALNTYEATTPQNWTSNNKLDSEDQTEAEFDYTLKANSFEGIHASFTEVNGHVSLKDLHDPYAISTFGSGSGTVHCVGFEETKDGTHWDMGDATYYNNAMYMTSATDPLFNQYIQIYRNTYGRYPHAECQNHGSYAPKNGDYTFTYSTSTKADGTVSVSVTINTRLPAIDYWPWDNWFYKYPYQQGMSYTFEIPPQKRDVTLSIRKTNDASYLLKEYPSDYSLQGAEFNVYTSSNQSGYLGKLVTDANGNASKKFNDIDYSIDTFYILETKAPKGHELRTDLIPVTIKDGAAWAEVSDTSDGEDITISKVDDANNYVPGATLQLKNLNTNTIMDTWTTDGTSHSVYVKPGKYQVDEISVPDGYYPAESSTFEVKPHVDGQTFTIEDTPIVYNVEKVDKKTNEKLAGVKLQLQNENGSVLEEWLTDGNPHTLGTGNLVNGWSGKLKYGTKYRIHEAETIDGYELMLDDVTFTVASKAQSAQLITVGNTSFDYEVLKIDAKTKKALSGVTLELYNEKGEKVDSWKTDGKAHKINAKKLRLNNIYTIKEIATIKGYYFTANDTQFKVENTGGLTQTITIEDYPIDYAIQKTDGETSDPLHGVKLAVYSKDNNQKIDEWTTDGNGHSLTGKLEAGKTYYVKELATVKGYYLDTATKEFTVEKKPVSSVEKHTINITFTNKRIKVMAGKVDALSGNYLAGAEMAIYDSNNTQIYTFTSTADGKTSLPNSLFEVGKTYYLAETKAPDGYYTMFTEDGKNRVSFTIPKTWQDVISSAMVVNGVEVTASDYKISYQVAKLNEKGDPVYNAHLGLYDSSNRQLEDWITDGNSHSITSTLKAGETYTIKELGNVQGYYKVLNTTFTVPTIPTDTNAVLTSEVTTVRITDNSIQWRIKKVDGDGNLLTTVDNVPFVFEVYDTNGTNDNPDDDVLIDTLSTDKPSYRALGYFEISDKLTTGKSYRVHEKSYPNGYTKAEDAYITIPQEVPTDNDGTIIPLETTIKDEDFNVKFTKVDENNTVLTTYVDSVTGDSKNFTFDAYDLADESTVAFTFDTSNVDKDGYVDLSNKVEWGHSYKVVERDFPTGYYKAYDFTFTVNNSNGITIKMVDPSIKARFRKYSTSGNVLSGKFEFKVVEVATGKTVDVLDLSKADKLGYVYFGDTLKENTTYQIIETDAARGYDKAKGYVEFTTPSYYSGLNEVNKGCVIRNGDTTKACTTWSEIYQ